MAKTPTIKTKPKGAPAPGALTLADLTLRRTVGRDTTTYTGQHLAQLLDATESLDASGAPDHLLEPGEIATELYELDHVVSALRHAVHDRDDEDPFGAAFVNVSRQLRRLCRRVLALDPSENRKPKAYTVTMKRGRR